MDILSDVLRAVRLTAAVFFDVQVTSPWILEAPPMAKVGRLIMPEAERVIPFHVVMAGESWAQADDGETPPARVKAGDAIIFSGETAHTLSWECGARAPSPPDEIFTRRSDRPLPFPIRSDGGGPDRAHFICGYLGCDMTPFNPIFAGLPPVIHAHGQAAESMWVPQLLGLAVEETRERRAGGQTVLAKLSELMFVEILRRYIDSLPEGASGWLAGLRDRHVGTALALMHARPAEAWTLDILAREAGLSRSVFAERFMHYVGSSPMNYLGRWRMQLAARLLEQPGISIGQAAREVGYESEAAFNRAFKKLVGAPPGAWRRGRGGERSGSHRGPGAITAGYPHKSVRIDSKAAFSLAAD